MNGTPTRDKPKTPGSKWKGAVFTFSDVVENHVGMEKIGDQRRGMTKSDLVTIKAAFKQKGFESQLLDLCTMGGDDVLAKKQDYGWVLVIPGGIGALGGDHAQLWDQVKHLGPNGVDTKFLNARRKIVQNKNARWNFNVTDRSQDPDYPSGKGTIYDFDRLDQLKNCREGLSQLIGQEQQDLRRLLTNLNAEANIYYSDDTGIGFHGDSERELVIGINLGMRRRIEWQAFDQTLPLGKRIKTTIGPGDVYFMEVDATGNNWKQNGYKNLHWRHRAGYDKWLDREERANQTKWDKRRTSKRPNPDPAAGVGQKKPKTSPTSAPLGMPLATSSFQCVFCREWGEGKGNNAQPLAQGRACDPCNLTRVLDFRLSEQQSPMDYIWIDD